MDTALGMPALRRLHALIGRLNGGRDLADTLQSVVDGVLDEVGFGVAVVSHVSDDGSFVTTAVAGSDDAKAALLGRRRPPDAFDSELEKADAWGALRFVPHQRLASGELSGWVPDVPILDLPDAWHPLDALYAPLRAFTGELVGMLSVDLPDDGRRPGAVQRELLEMFAAQAGIAIHNALLTERLREEQRRLAISEEAFRLAFDGSGMGMGMLDLDPANAGRYLRVNQTLADITGYPVDQLVTMSFVDVTHPDDRAEDAQALDRGLSGEQTTYRADKRYLRRDGSTVWVQVTTSVVQSARGGEPFAISHVEDITARRVAEDELAHRASHDPLTGLPNRSMLIDRLIRAHEHSERTGRTGAVLFCDLDGFKDVNDEHGHDAGDVVLAHIAGRLPPQLRGGDFAARFGGDEFVVLAEDITAVEVTALAERIEDAVRRPVRIGDIEAQLTVSVGIAPIRATDGADTSALTALERAERLLRLADSAMYEAKYAGRGRHVMVGW